MNAADRRHMITLFWASFLLVHLGVSAYAMADNELWPRHLLGLTLQVITTLYIFMKSFSNFGLNILWLLILIVGSIDWESPRPHPIVFTRGCLVVVSYQHHLVIVGGEIETIPSSSVIDVNPGQSQDPPDGVNEDYERIANILHVAYSFFTTFRKLVGDMTLSIQDREISVFYFKDLRWDDAFLIGLAFDLFYTKLPLAFSLFGIILRHLSFSITITAFFTFLALFFKNMMHYPKEDV
ncbi:hypothetical protein SASPL_146152 [Salvia splendens]|uniref:DUF4220 domain-containing protein n=1 Tax=Salvia splendens TaxID=180675 RepID=A0A8X8Z8R6_SALSN|nr:hypothetical protein SASPL_146152 [Salvia splendens]